MLPSANTSDEKLAAYLHSKFCSWNHADGCSWFYEKTWKNFAHNSWLIKARALKSQLPQILKEESSCLCWGCNNEATETENSPYMNEYCDDCTYERHDLPQERNPHR